MLTVIINTDEIFNLKSIIKCIKTSLWNLEYINSMKFWENDLYKKETHKHKRWANFQISLYKSN